MIRADTFTHIEEISESWTENKLMKYLIYGVTISTALLLGACSGDDDDGDDNGGDSIAGLWDVTDVDPDFGEDIFYLRIMEDGTVTSYDYQQDEFDAGDNCYIIGNDQTLTPLGGDQYRSESTDFPDDAETLTITSNGNLLTVSYVDTFDENNNGNVTEILTFNYPLLTGLDPVFNECT